MLNPFQRYGKDSEAAAARLLKRSGYRILEKNYRNAIGEIDIIAREGESLVFVEVKARRSGRFGSAKGAITRQKQQKLSRTALLYLKETGQTEASARFDVVAIDGIGPGQSIDIIKNAFDLRIA